MSCMLIFFKGEPGFIGPQGEPGLPGLPGTKVSRPLSPLLSCKICLIPTERKVGGLHCLDGHIFLP